MKIKLLSSVLALVCATTLSGCFLVKAQPIAATSFLPNRDLLKSGDVRTPFNDAYTPNPARLDSLKKTYNGIYFLPIETKYAEEKIKKHRFLGEAGIAGRIEETKEVAEYMRQRFIQSIKDYKGHPFQPIETPTETSFIVELNISDIQPTEPFTNIIGSTVGFFITGGGLIKIFGTGSIAMEGIFRDGATKDILVEFKDREADKSAPFTIRDFSMYAHIRRTIDEWAKQFAELSATTQDHIVEEAWAVTLNPL